jgi:hypothetical protein
MSGETVLLDTKPDKERANTVKELSRLTYGFVKQLETEKESSDIVTTKPQKARKYKRSRSGSISAMAALDISNAPTDT